MIILQIYEINKYGDKLPKLDESATIIGNFDGIHLGHQMLIHQLLEQKYYKRMVISFENLYKDDYILTTKEDKIAFFQKMEIDYLIFIDFNNYKNVFYNEFIKILKKLNVKEIYCGADFRFGFKAEGDIIDLENNFHVEVVSFYEYGNQKLSSTLIKKMLEYEDIQNVNELLNRNYQITGSVIHGSGIGASLGFKTANILYQNYKLPREGVYLVSVIYNDTKYYGICSISHNPSINYQDEKRLEVHILDFDEDLYDKIIAVKFIKQIGSIIKFNSKEELIMALNTYKQLAYKLIDDKNG